LFPGVVGLDAKKHLSFQNGLSLTRKIKEERNKQRDGRKEEQVKKEYKQRSH
jgi:hypothetical protein